MSNFSIFFPSGQKKSLQVGPENTRVEGGPASYLLRVKCKLGSGPIPTADPCDELLKVITSKESLQIFITLKRVRC